MYRNNKYKKRTFIIRKQSEYFFGYVNICRYFFFFFFFFFVGDAGMADIPDMFWVWLIYRVFFGGKH